MGFRFPRVQSSTNLSSLSTLSTIFSRFILRSPVQNRKPSILEMMSMHESKQQQPSILNMMMRESTDSPLQHDYTSSFQSQNEKMLAAMTQARLAREHDLDLMVQTLRSHRPADSDIADHSLRADEPSCFGQQDSISVPSFELAETPILDNLASFSFPEIELEHEYDHDLPLDDSILFPDSIMTPVSKPDFTFPESTLDPVPIHHEIESPIFDDHIELDQFYDFESTMDKLASLFMTLNPMRYVT